MPMLTEDDNKLVNKNHDDAIAEVVGGSQLSRNEQVATKDKAMSKSEDENTLTISEQTDEAEIAEAENVTANQKAVEEWLASRKEAALRIDSETAEVDWCYAQTLDPYGVLPDLPKECKQVGREYFARAPGSDIWVWFGDLPDVTRNALWSRHSSKLAFPAGLSNQELEEMIK
jgi:hypothetical protein